MKLTRNTFPRNKNEQIQTINPKIIIFVKIRDTNFAYHLRFFESGFRCATPSSDSDPKEIRLRKRTFSCFYCWIKKTVSYCFCNYFSRPILSTVGFSPLRWSLLGLGKLLLSRIEQCPTHQSIRSNMFRPWVKAVMRTSHRLVVFGVLSPGPLGGGAR